MPSSHLKNIAIIGVSGSVGKFITEALIEKGRHTITALTRAGAGSRIPKDLTAKEVDYDSHDSIVNALQGIELLIITMGVTAPHDIQVRIANAAKDAGVQYIVPNEWGYDKGQGAGKAAGEDTMLGRSYTTVRDHIEHLGLTWISVPCGFWYEFSLSGTEARYGFDFNKRTLTLYNEGDVKITTSTWPQVGRAVANLLSLPLESSSEASFHQYNNKPVIIGSFYINQKDMFESVLRVTGTKKSDWTVTTEDVKERFDRGRTMMQSGDRVGFGIMLYARYFYPDGSAGEPGQWQNDVLGLPKENLDQATKVAVDMAAKGGPAY